MCLDEKSTFRDCFENLGLPLFCEADNVLHIETQMTVRRTWGIDSRVSMEEVRSVKIDEQKQSSGG